MLSTLHLHFLMTSQNWAMFCDQAAIMASSAAFHSKRYETISSHEERAKVVKHKLAVIININQTLKKQSADSAH